MSIFESQILGMIKDRFDSMDAKLDRFQGSFDEHARMDAKYWKMIDGQQAQISLIKWLSGGLSGSALVAWLYAKFGGH